MGSHLQPPKDDPWAAVRGYLEHVGQSVVVNNEFQLPAWDALQFLRVFQEVLDKAAGLDGWAPRHWRHLSVCAAKWLLVLFA